MKGCRMFRCQSRNLPVDQQPLLHPDFLANEKAYQEMHGSLLAQYRGQWVAVQDKKVIASGVDLLSVSQAALVLGGHPFIACVGAEDEVVFRIRRQEFAYDSSYKPFALPRVSVEKF